MSVFEDSQDAITSSPRLSIFNQLMEGITQNVKDNEIIEDEEIFDEVEDDNGEALETIKRVQSPPSTPRSGSSSQPSSPKSNTTSQIRTPNGTNNDKSDPFDYISNLQNFLKNGAEDLERFKNDTQKLIFDKQQRVDVLSLKLSSVERENETLRTEAIRLFSEKDAKINELTSKLEESSKQIETLISQNRSTQSASEEKTKELQNLVDLSDEKIEELYKQLEFAQQQVNERENEMDTMRRQIDEELIKMKNDANEQLDNKNKEIENLNSTIALLTSQMEDLKQQTNATVASSHPSANRDTTPVPAQDITFHMDDEQSNVSTLHNGSVFPVYVPPPSSSMNIVNNIDPIQRDGEVKILRARLESCREEISSLRKQLYSGKKSDHEIKMHYEKEMEKYKTQLAFKEEEIRALIEEANAVQAMRNISSSPRSPVSGNEDNEDNMNENQENVSPKKRRTVITPRSSPKKTKMNELNVPYEVTFSPYTSSPKKKKGTSPIHLDKPHSFTTSPNSGMRITIEPATMMLDD